MAIKVPEKNRTQKVSRNNNLSTESRAMSDVPQGSVLIPVMFTICNNELLQLVKSKVKLFADDAKVYKFVTGE